MTNKLLYIFALTSILFVSCSKNNDDDNNDTSSDLLGTWTATSVNYTGTSVTTVQGNSIESTYVGTGYDIDFTVTFTENPNQMTSAGDYSVELSTTFAGQTITQNVENLAFSEVGAWTREGDQLTVTSSNGTGTCTITTLTSTEFAYVYESTETITENGATTTTDIVMNVTYTR